MDYKIALMTLTETCLCEMKMGTSGVGSTLPGPSLVLIGQVLSASESDNRDSRLEKCLSD